jgi:hypothetical protein
MGTPLARGGCRESASADGAASRTSWVSSLFRVPLGAALWRRYGERCARQARCVGGLTRAGSGRRSASGNKRRQRRRGGRAGRAVIGLLQSAVRLRRSLLPALRREQVRDSGHACSRSMLGRHAMLGGSLRRYSSVRVRADMHYARRCWDMRARPGSRRRGRIRRWSSGGHRC